MVEQAAHQSELQLDFSIQHLVQTDVNIPKADVTPLTRVNPTATVEADSEKPEGDLTPPATVNPTHIVDTHTEKPTVEADSEKPEGDLAPPAIVNPTHKVDTHTEKPEQVLPPLETTTTLDPPTQTVEQLEDIRVLMMMNSTNEFYLPRKVRMELTTFRGADRIDIRQRDISGYRTKIGVALNLPRFKTMMLYFNELEAALESTLKGLKVDYEKHLGGDFYVYVDHPSNASKSDKTISKMGR